MGRMYALKVSINWDLRAFMLFSFFLFLVLSHPVSNPINRLSLHAKPFFSRFDLACTQ